MTILPLYAAPQYAPQVTDHCGGRLFGGETLPREFFASIVQHSQTAQVAPYDLIAVWKASSCSARLAFWRCDLISRCDLGFLAGGAAALRPPPAVRGWPENCSGM